MSSLSENNEDATSPSESSQLTGIDENQTSGCNDLKLSSLRKEGPLVSALQAGLQRKASPFLIGSWTTLSLTLDGRDKITKFLQYWSRLLAYYYSSRRNASGSGYDAAAAASWHALYTNLSLSRKAFYLGRSVVEIEKLRNLGLWTALSLLGAGGKTTPQARDDVWKLVGTALKTLGLCGYWAADNLNFLTSIGCLDDKLCGGGAVTDRSFDRVLQLRKARQLEWGIRANRSYFFGSVAGLVVSVRAYLLFRRTQVAAAYQMWKDAKTDEQVEAAREHLQSVKEKQFLVTLDLIKSCSDVLVFSNNPGVNLWEKFHGRKLHEGIHCFGGMMSAAAALYNNYPNAAGCK
jgi:hypothetical protein